MSATISVSPAISTKTEVSSSLINLRAVDYETAPGSKVIDWAAVVKNMEEQNKGCVLPYYTCESKEPNVLCNLQNVPAPISKFQYRFYSMGPRCIIRTAMTAAQALFRFNQTAEGEKLNESLFNHPDVLFEGICGESTTGKGTFATAHNRTFRVVNCQMKNIENGLVNKGFCDNTSIENYTGDHTVTGWLWQGENGDGQKFVNIQAYGGKGLLAKHGSGTATGLVSGEHKFIAAKYVILDEHLEGDGPNEVGGKSQVPLLVFEGGEYLVKACRMYTLNSPNRAAWEINDSGQAERCTTLTFENVRFMQRLDDPANPAEVVEPIGNIQGIAGKCTEMSTKSILRFIDTYAEVFQQTAGVAGSSQFDVRAKIGFKLSAPGASASQVSLQEQFTNRRVMISGSDCEIKWNPSTEAFVVRPIGSSNDTVTTHRFATPALNLSKFASGSEEAKAAPTTLPVGEVWYAAHVVDDRSRRTNLSTERKVTLGAGETPVVQIIGGGAQACRVILWRGKKEKELLEWTEIILPLGQATVADMGSAAGGQVWSAASLPSKPSTTASENNTAAGTVILDVSSTVANSFGTAIPTSGEWQKVGDSFTITTSGIRYTCVTAPAGNNGGTWKSTTPAEHGRSAEMVSGKVTIAAPAVTAGGAILISMEGTTMTVAPAITERTPGTGFKVETVATSTDRVNWAVYVD